MIDLTSYQETHLLDALHSWDPESKAKRVSCGNCLYATIHGVWPVPIAACAQGYGRRAEIPLLRLIGPANGRGQGFAPAKDCPSFSSMSDTDEAR